MRHRSIRVSCGSENGPGYGLKMTIAQKRVRLKCGKTINNVT